MAAADGLWEPARSDASTLHRLNGSGASKGQLAFDAQVLSAIQGSLMNLSAAEKKLREASFFLDRMRDQESRASGDKEPFDFYLSAFLNAARTVQHRLEHEAGKAPYKKWRKSWEAGHQPAADLIKFLVDDRNLEVHHRGSTRTVATKEVPIPDSYSDRSGRVQVTSPPGAPGATLTRENYEFIVNGVMRGVTDACTEYLARLGEMVADFRRAHP